MQVYLISKILIMDESQIFYGTEPARVSLDLINENAGILGIIPFEDDIRGRTLFSETEMKVLRQRLEEENGGDKVILVNPLPNISYVVINGVKYREKTGLNCLFLNESLFHLPEFSSKSCLKAKPKEYTHFELIKEFVLIKNMKSSLSRSQRLHVEKLFFNKYEKID